jgi:hypothetical protein
MDWTGLPNDLTIGAAILIVTGVVLTAMAFVEILARGSIHWGNRYGESLAYEPRGDVRRTAGELKYRYCSRNS